MYSAYIFLQDNTYTEILQACFFASQKALNIADISESDYRTGETVELSFTCNGQPYAFSYPADGKDSEIDPGLPDTLRTLADGLGQEKTLHIWKYDDEIFMLWGDEQQAALVDSELGYRSRLERESL